MPLQVLECPKCGAQIRTLAKEAWHRCTFNRNRMTEFIRKDSDE